MRKIILSTVLAALQPCPSPPPSQAGYYSYDYQPTCYIKKIKTWTLTATS